MDRVLALGDPGYPARLRDLARPPDPVYLRGGWDHDGPVVAIVGSRGAPHSGLEMARRVAADLARDGAAVVSGLAAGIDTAAHEGALDAGGRTGAVLGTPLDEVYPPENRALHRRVAESLGLMSELAPGAHASRATFPSRNRLLAALANAVVVVQAREGSGALHTVAAAAKLGRPIGAVPWDPDEAYGAAPLALIRAGRAVLVRDAADILALVGGRPSRRLLAARAVRAAAPRGAHGARGGASVLAAQETPEARVLAGLSRSAVPLDVVAARASLGAAETSVALLSLELAGLARREPGGRFRLARGA